MNELNLGLVVQDEKVAVGSRDVARVFEKEHARIMRDIRDLDCSTPFRVGNFAESSYINEQNREMPEYLMTRDGFTLLAMGYTGARAMEFKEAYITAFNEMEKLLQSDENRKLQKSKELLKLIATAKGSISVQMMDSLVGEVASLITGKPLPSIDSTSFRSVRGIGSTVERALPILRSFLEESDSELLVSMTDLHRELTGWCAAKGVSLPSKNATGRALRALGWMLYKGSNGKRLWTMQEEV